MNRILTAALLTAGVTTAAIPVAIVAIGATVGDRPPATASTGTGPAPTDTAVHQCQAYGDQLAAAPYALPGPGLAASDRTLADDLAAWSTSTDPQLVAAGRRYSTVHAALTRPSTADQHTHAQHVQAFRQLAAACARHGVTLTWTPE